MLKKLSLVVGTVLLLAACGANTAEESVESVGTVTAELAVCPGNPYCPAGYHPVGYVCDSSCSWACSGSPHPYSVTNCDANTSDFWQCSNWYCPSGYSDRGLACDNSMSDCGSCNNGYNANVRRCTL
ncbi:hypothetical protein [Archangium lansingense]|uniref:Lipoprotein n=1 Tax=Archangium lansingense TaxID=2995310 RepID=A0ABT4AH80_9BACT|nr:hypothetical protein [Archangium lansinium]MCY1081023.1 hypothetical protein [Archangium lansinium]